MWLLAWGVALAQGGRVVEVGVEGNLHVATDEILRQLKFSKVDSPIPTEQQLKSDAEAVAAMGYFEIPVEARRIPVEGGVRVVFQVSEFPKLDRVEIQGNDHVPSADILKDLILRPGSVYNFKHLNLDVGRIENTYEERGYRCEVTEAVPKRSPDGTYTLTFVVEEYRIQDILYEGLTRTRRYVVEQEVRMALHPGDVFDMRQLRRALSLIRKRDLFEAVDVSAEKVPEAVGRVNIKFKFTERRSGLVAVGGGYSSRNRFVGYVQVGENNLLGRGHTLNLNYEFGGISSVDFTFIEPRLRGSRTLVSLSIYNMLVNRLIGSGFQSAENPTERNERRAGMLIGMNRPLRADETLSGGIYLRSEAVASRLGVYGQSVLQPFYTLGKVGAIQTQLTYDTTILDPDPLIPRTGWRNTLWLETAGGFLGGERDFQKWRFDLRRYLPVGQRDVVALRLQYGMASGDLPLFETFTAGGADTIRGYPEERFWGKRMSVFTFEYRKSLDPERKMQLIGFLDYGDAWQGVWVADNGAAIFPAEHQDFSGKWGYGLGLAVRTPIGPLSLGFGFSKEGQEPYFRIGPSF